MTITHTEYINLRVAKFSFIQTAFPTHPASGKVVDSREAGPSTTSSNSGLHNAATLEYLPNAKGNGDTKSKAEAKETYEHENTPAAVATMCGLTPAEQSAAVGKGNKERGRPRKKGTPKARAANPKAKSAPKPKAKAKAKAKAKSQAKQTAHDTGKRRRSKNTTAPKAAPVVEDTGDTTASGSDAKDDSTHAEVAEAKAPRKRMAKKSRKAQKVEKTTEAEAVEQDDSPAPKSKAPGKKKKGKLAPTSAPAEASTSPVGKAKSKPTKKGNATKSTRAKAESQSAGSSKAEGSTVDDKKLQQKQKNARKSLAYRQAYKKAKDEGLDDDACKAAGRKVLWQHLLIYNLVHDFHARKFHNDFVVTFGSTQAGLSLGIKAYKDAEWAGRAKTFGHGTRCFPMKVSVVASRINKGIESRPQRKNVVRSCLMSWGLGVTGEFKATALLKKHVTGLINSLILVTRGLRIWPRRPFRVALGVSVLKMEPCLTLQHASQQKHQYSILKKNSCILLAYFLKTRCSSHAGVLIDAMGWMVRAQLAGARLHVPSSFQGFFYCACFKRICTWVYTDWD